jgi:hypothetical protein
MPATDRQGTLSTMRQRQPRPAARAALAAIVALASLAGAAVPASAADDFPDGWTAYHTYPELRDELAAVEAAHPDIVDRFSIGESHRGRQLWAAKISDNVASDEDEPEVLFDGLHHGDEHMSLEMTLRILHWLTDGYGSDPRITDIVDGREVWIVFAMNPDGATFDIKDGRFHRWRKNRQPNANGTVGTDLNRNYGYRWGGGGRTSSRPGDRTYRGAAAFSTPETRAMRDFLASRVVDGRQQIRAAITFHESGRLVMWPYGYTHTNVPGDMTTDDHAAFVKLGRRMAASNGYTPQQASELYVSSGTSRDYLYGTYRIFVFTFELSITDYPKNRKIATETGRNKEAVLTLMERAWCPLGILGAAVRDARCGAFDDDLEVARGWTVDPDGTDTAPASGRWQRGNPEKTRSGGGVTLQRDLVPSGRFAFVTGAPAGDAPDDFDLDGRTTIRSAPIRLPDAAGQALSFRWLFAHAGNSTTSADHLQAIVEGPGGDQTVVWERVGSATTQAGSWGSASVSLDAWAGEAIRLRFEAVDAGNHSLVEAGLDDIRVTRPGG